MKDNFSTNSAQYAKFRPGYPPELYRDLLELVPNREIAWDCGTGNGQMAAELAKDFRRVEATDISAEQLREAVRLSNINYSREPAESTTFPDEYFDLITVAQAIHWFDFSAFYREVKRTLKPEGLVAVTGYSLFKSNSRTNQVIQFLYKDLLGPYWDKERKYLDEEYKTIPFPFEEIQIPDHEQIYQWEFSRLIGYLKTWSGVKHYEKATGINPVVQITPDLRKSFGTENKVVFPILVRIGKKI